MHVLLIEDEGKLTHLLARALKKEGYQVTVTHDGVTGLRQALTENYAVIILDVVLPEKSGLDVCRALRERKVMTPVLMLSSRDTSAERMAGIDAGANCYMTKPFELGVLLHLVRMLADNAEPKKAEVLSYGDLSLDMGGMRVIRAGDDIHLRPREFAVLAYLLRYPEITLTREQLFEHIWGREQAYDFRLLRVTVQQLRKKIDEAYTTALIHTKRGEGYCLGEKCT